MKKSLTAEFEIQEGLEEYEQQKEDEYNSWLDEYLLPYDEYIFNMGI
jgi:hypothetical protein